MTDVGPWLRRSYEENYRLITTDRKLQSFMVGVFSFLLFTILCCENSLGYGRAPEYYAMADAMLSGAFDFRTMGTDLSPVTLLLLVPPKLFSPDAGIFCILFSVYGFAFYMLGGHFMLKYCRESGFSERDAYILLFVTFVCAFTDLTLGTGSFAATFAIISLWFFQRRNYVLSFGILALATATGYYPFILFPMFVIHAAGRKEMRTAIPGIGIYAVGALSTAAFLLWRSPLGSITDTQWFMMLAAVGLSFLFGMTVRERLETRMAALAAEIVLCVLMMVSYQEGLAFVWIAMLYPMTRMTSQPFRMQNVQYVSLAVFGLLALVCAHADYGFLPYLRTASILLFTVLLCVELWSATRADLEK